MQTVDKQTSIIDERLFSEEFRQKLLKSPILKAKQKKGLQLGRALQKIRSPK